MGALEGRIAVITGAGRGIGREHALLFAAEGAAVVVNDLGGGNDGSGQDSTPAEEVVAEIVAAGGRAVANHDNVADWEGARRLVEHSIAAFGDIDILVNNAGILRDRLLVNMTEQEWDAVITVHLKGHFAPSRWAAAHWREQAKAGSERPRNIVNTSSTSGLNANPGQSNYGAAKSGIATFTQITAKELARYGVKVNAIAPAARTRLTMATPGLGEQIAPPSAPGAFDEWDPANISPLVAYLASEACAFTGETFFVRAGEVTRFRPWETAESVTKNGRWDVDELSDALGAMAADISRHQAP